MQQGDTVAVVAPSGPVDSVLLGRGTRRLEGIGLKVVVGPHVLDRQDLGYLAGSDAARAADLESAWCDPAVGAVFCARGGYGAARLLGLLDWDRMRAAGPKTLIGSSDITAQHHAFAAELGVPTLHGPMPGGLLLGGEQGPEPATWEHLRAVLFGASAPVTGDLVLAPGRATGVLSGGNLSLLASLCGTGYQPSFAGRIALLEDIGEQPYRVDRLLTQLLQSGAFAGVRQMLGDEDRPVLPGPAAHLAAQSGEPDEDLPAAAEGQRTPVRGERTGVAVGVRDEREQRVEVDVLGAARGLPVTFE